MEKIKLDFSGCIENIIEMAEHINSLTNPEDENNIGDILQALPERLKEDLTLTLYEIKNNFEFVVGDFVRELLKAKNILNYEDENCNFEYLQDIPNLIIEEGAEGYDEMLKECNITNEELTSITVIKEQN